MSSDLDSLASAEQSKLQARVREFQAEMSTQAQLQQAITDIHAQCFTMCVTSVSAPGGLTSSERACVKQCTGRYIDTMQTMMKLFAKKK